MADGDMELKLSILRSANDDAYAMLVSLAGGDTELARSILKSASDNGDALRFFFEYPGLAAGEGRFISTYGGDGTASSFEGEPVAVAVNGIGGFAEAVWDALDEDNRVALFVRAIPLDGGQAITKIINKHG